MKRLLFAIAPTTSLSTESGARTAGELIEGATNTHDVLTYVMGYNLQRHSTLTKIDKDTAKFLAANACSKVN